VRYERGSLCAVGDTLSVPDIDQGIADPPDTFAPTSPLLPRQVARAAYQQPWKLQRKHTAAFHTCWLTVACPPPCLVIPLVMVGGCRCETSSPTPQAKSGRRWWAARIVRR
jgi:hypothetical protein